MELGVPELILIAVIVILLFGVGRIGRIASELGGGIRAFREGLRGDEPISEISGVKKTEGTITANGPDSQPPDA